MKTYILELFRNRDFHQNEANRFNQAIQEEREKCAHQWPNEPDVITHGQEVYYCLQCGELKTENR